MKRKNNLDKYWEREKKEIIYVYLAENEILHFLIQTWMLSTHTDSYDGSYLFS
jgi:hypothetical protein